MIDRRRVLAMSEAWAKAYRPAMYRDLTESGQLQNWLNQKALAIEGELETALSLESPMGKSQQDLATQQRSLEEIVLAGHLPATAEVRDLLTPQAMEEVEREHQRLLAKWAAEGSTPEEAEESWAAVKASVEAEAAENAEQ